MLVKYSLIQLVGKFVPGLIAFVVAAILTRLLSPADFGALGLATALAQLLSLAAFGWLGLSVMRLATGRSPDSGFAASVLAIFAATGVAVLALAPIAFLLPLEPGQGAIIAAAIVGGIVFAYFDLKSSFLTADFKFPAFLVMNLARAGASAVAALTAAYVMGGGLAVFLALCGATLAVTFLFGGPRTVAASGVNRQAIRAICAFGLPISGSLTLFALSGWTDRVILGLYSGTAAVGLYAAAAIIIQNTLQLAAQAIGSAAYPLAVVAYESGRRDVAVRQLEQNFTVLLGILLPAGVGMCMLAPNIAASLVGRDYHDAILVLTPLLAAAAVISGIRGNFIDHAFQLSGNTWHYLGISASMMTVNFAALLLLVPRYHYLGAGLASLATAIAGFLHALIASRRVYPMPLPFWDVAKILASVVAMTAVLGPLVSLRGMAALCLQIAAGGTAYAAVFFALNILNLRHAALAMLLSRRVRP
jgi:O-antigen/teichoic acid export membrane protein